MSLAARLTAIGFALGSAVHAASWAARYPRWRVFPLTAFSIDQFVEHGVRSVGVLVLAAAVVAAHERWQRPTSG